MQDQGHKTPEDHSGEAEATTGHSHQDTTIPDTRTPQLQTKPTNLTAPHQMPMCIMHQEHLTWVHPSTHTRHLTANSKTKTTHKISSITTTCFAEQSSKMPQQDATAIIEQLQQLLLPQKNLLHQVTKVKAMTPQPGSTWDLKAAIELPMVQEDQVE